MRYFTVIALLASLVAADIEFTSPPSSGDVGDYAQNPTFVLGSVQNILWTSDTDKEISLVLCQNRENDAFEYVFAQRANLTSFKWNVGTQKSLSNTNVFFFEIFVAGETSPSAISHYFNLTRGATDNSGSSSSSTSTSSSSTSSSTGTSSSTSNTVASQTSQPTNSNTPAPSPEANSDGGLSTGAKVGMGVGIPIAIGLGLLAGWFIFGRNRNKDPAATIAAGGGGETPGTDYAAPHGEYYAPNAMSEQANGGYKPATAGAASEAPSTSPPSEIYTPPQQAVELPSGHGTWR